MNSKKVKILRNTTITLFIVFLLTSTIFYGSASKQTISSSAITAKKGVVVIYDSHSPTIVKSEELFSELITHSKIDITQIPISSEQEFNTIISQLSTSYHALVLIGHGSWLGIQFGLDIIRWENVREDLSEISIKKKVLLSCYSSILPLGLPESEQSSYIGFETKIDYMVACYSAAHELAIELQYYDLIDKITQQSDIIKDILIRRAVYTPEPLWWGTTHNNIASLAKDEVGTSKWDSVNDNTGKYMDDANRADNKDKVVGASMTDILFDAGRLKLWLKHNYGIRGGVEVYTNILWYKIVLLTVGAIYGSAPSAAQTAYDNAVFYYNIGYYSTAGKHLSYAIHYGQDMTMPYHVFDYAKIKIWVNPTLIGLIVSILDTIAGGLDDYYALDKHDNMEEWAHDYWSYLKDDTSFNFWRWTFYSRGVKYIASHDSYSIGSGSNAVKNAVEDIAEWTRSQMSRSSADSFESQSQSRKRSLLKYLLAKAVDFSTALYNKFINEV